MFPRWERPSQVGNVVRAALIWKRDRIGAGDADPMRFHLKPGVSEDWRGAGCEDEPEEETTVVRGGCSAFAPLWEM